eukprot:COSAG02_NODE_36019_length_460_cov_0.662050_1_plen_69_part_10
MGMGGGLLLEDYWHYPSRGARQAHGGWRVAAWPAGQPRYAKIIPYSIFPMMITRIGLLTHTPRKFPCVN